jgi:YHS domain-containing protein
MTNQIKQLQVAVSGYDAVACFDGQAIADDPAFSSIHNDGLYHFASEANKQKFDEDPERYIPLYGGY